MTDREIMQMALDALEHGLPIIEDFGGKEQLQIQHKAISALYEALRARLAQPEPESMDWMEDCADFWNRYTYLNERAQEKYDEEAQMWIKKLRENAND